MFTPHRIPALAVCAAVALIGFADAGASARGFGGDVHACGATAEHHYIESAHLKEPPSNFEPLSGLNQV